MKKITIGITHSEARYENYPKWIKGDDADIEIIELSAEHQNWDEIEDCDGILLTGGVDMHPQFYDSKERKYPFAPEEFNVARDEFEMHVFETALNLEHPILAICRGHQLVNVALGGNLIQDIAAANEIHKRGEEDKQHGITTEPGTLLREISGESGQINSAHHQAIKDLSEELMVNSHSPDGIVEGAEWLDKDDKPWLLTVQWHPERMLDKETNPFSHNIREAFLKAVRGKV
ncbi:MAG: peptidase [Bacteroidetes bacterium]|nr:peptidase [Bacteroidota bacterium]